MNSWHEARRRAYTSATPLPEQSMPLADALDAVLAAPLHAPVALPAVDRSAMDGYAVRGEPPWTVVGRVLVDASTPTVLADREACEVATGAPLPASTTAVLPYERASRSGAGLTGPVRDGAHIRRAGEECAAGEQILPAGSVIGAVTLGLAAALGHDRLCARPRPLVSALVTGDELRDHGRPGLGGVRDAIGPMLPGLVRDAGGRLADLGRLADSRSALVEALSAAGGDLVLVSGSSSAGPADHLRPGLAALGAELLVDGVACRPGHPQTLARLPDGRLVVGLPGNPFAALVAFLTLALPAIARMRGDRLAVLEEIAAPTLARHDSGTRLVPVRLYDGKAEPVEHAGAAMLRGVAIADVLAVVPPAGADTPVLAQPIGACC